MLDKILNEIRRLNDEAETAHSNGLGDEALNKAIRAYQLGREGGLEGSPDYVETLRNLGELYLARGDHAAARPLLEEDLEICRRTLGDRAARYPELEPNLRFRLVGRRFGVVESEAQRHRPPLPGRQH